MPHSADASPAANLLSRRLFVVGAGGIGKSRLIREVTANRHERIGGFYLTPILSGRIRRGVRLHTLDGQERMLAQKGLKSPQSLGKFGFDVNAIENVGIPALKLGLMTKELLVIDELGVFEPMSERFKSTVSEAFHSSKPILATLRPGVKPWSEQIKKMPQSQVLLLTQSNYTAVKFQVRKWLDAHL